MAKHTPGPWEIRRTRMTGTPNVYASDDMLVMTTDRLSSEIEANARLIAAAPDLYDMLKALLDAHYPTTGSEAAFWTSSYATPDHIAVKARKALTKVEAT